MRRGFSGLRVLVVGLLFAGLVGCGSGVEPGGKEIGQRCYSDSDCRSGLVCYQRICTAPTPTDRAGGEDMGVDQGSGQDMTDEDIVDGDPGAEGAGSSE